MKSFLLVLCSISVIAVFPSSSMENENQTSDQKDKIEMVNNIGEDSVYMKCPQLLKTPMTTGKIACVKP